MWNNSIFALAGLGVGTMFAIFILWSLVWKGFALWIAARESKKWWFIPLFVVNTAGILEIIYIFVFSSWGRNFINSKRNRKKDSNNSNSENQKTECDCTSCDGVDCDCNCHRPIKDN